MKGDPNAQPALHLQGGREVCCRLALNRHAAFENMWSHETVTTPNTLKADRCRNPKSTRLSKLQPVGAPLHAGQAAVTGDLCLVHSKRGFGDSNLTDCMHKWQGGDGFSSLAGRRWIQQSAIPGALYSGGTPHGALRSTKQ